MSPEIFQIAPAKAKRYPWEKIATLLTSPIYYIEPKLDGWRFLMHLSPHHRMYLTGRHISVKTNLFSEKGLCAPNLEPRATIEDYTVLDGEVMPPLNASFRDIAGIMNVDPAEAKRRIQEIGHPIYNAFDLLFLNGRDLRRLPQNTRRELLEQCFTPTTFFNIVTPKYSNLEQHFDDWVSAGGEGAILKNRQSPYGHGWVKLKRFSSLDVIVTGFTPAEPGKYAGLIGSIEVSVYRGSELIPVGNVSGMDDETRRIITSNQRSWLGAVLEIKAQEFAKNRLRHPRFVRRRYDANPRDCTWQKQLEDLKSSAVKEYE